MDDKYIKDIYDNLGGESVFGNYNDYYSLITSDDSYIKDVYDSQGESVFGSYDDFVSLVKKKDDSVVSTSQEGVTESTTKEEKTPTSLESSDVTVDIPTLEEEEEFELYIPDAPYREGVLSNEDGSVSTHKMRTETDGQGNWFSFPTVFQNKDGSFVDMSNQAEQDWSSVYEVAQNRDEVIDFGDDKESAIAYGKGSWKPIYDANKNIQLLDSVGYIEANEDFRSLGLEGISDFDKERLESREKSYRLKNPETGEIQYKKESQIKPEIIEAIKIYETSRDDSYKKNYTDVQVDVEDFDRDDVPDASKLDSLGINQEDYLKWDKVNTRQEGSVFKFMKRLLTSEEGDEFEKEQRQYEKLQSYQATQLNGITNDLEKNQAKQKLTSNPEKIKVLKKEEKNLQKEFYSKVQVMSRAIDLFPKFKEKTVDKDLEKRKRLYSAVKEGGLNETSQGTIELLRAGGTALSDFSINFLGGIPAFIDQRLATIGYDKKGFLAGLSDMFTDSAEHVDLEYGAVKRSGFMSGKPVTYRGQQYFVDKNGKVYDTETNILMDGIIPLSDVKEIQKRSKDVPEEETMWTGGSVATGLTSTLVNLFGLIRTGGKVKNTLGLKGKRAGSIGMGITSFTSGVVDNVDDIRSQLIATGMSEKEAMDIAVNAGQAISTLDGIFSGLAGSNEKLLTGLTGIKNQIKNLAITKGKDFTTKEFKRKFSELIKENGKELFVEELPVLFSEKGINYLVNRSIGQNVLDSKITKENIIETAVMTLGATSILGSRKLLSGNNRADLVRTIAADIGDLQGTLDALVKEGSLTKKEASNAYTEIYSMQTAENLTKGTILVSENMETASDLLIQRQKLINQKEGLEGPGKQNIDNKIADVDAQLDALYKKDKQEAEDIINKTKTDEDSIQEQKTDAEPAEGVQEVEAEVREPFVTEKKKEKISDALNRPITLTDLGGSKLDTPIEGDMYVDGQRVVVEDADGNITEIGNVDEISDSTLEDMGIVPQESDVKTDSQGNLIVGEDTLLPNKKGIKRDKRGNISRVVLQSPDGSVTRTLRGANAEDAAYQILLKEAQSPEQEQKINELLEQDEEFQNELRQAEDATESETDTDTDQAVTEGAITPEESSNYANLTEDAEGNFVFFHIGDRGYDTIERNSGKTSATSKEEAAALSKVGGLAMYYTGPKDSETQVSGDTKYAVKVPASKVYDFNTDPLGFIEEARARHNQENPNSAFDPNSQVAYVTKIAGENGFEMVVSQWAGKTRAQTTKEFKPNDTQELKGNEITKPFIEEYTSNLDLGFESIIPETRDEKLSALYDKINKERNLEQRYDDLYSLREDYIKKSQDEITKLIEGSDLSQEIKDEYKEILEFKEEKRRSVDRKNDSVFTDKTEMPNAPKGVFLDIEMVSGKEGRKMSEQEVLDALPFDTVEVDNDGKNLRIKIPRELSSKEMMSLMKATEQEAIGQVVDGMGVLYAQNEEFRKDYGDKFNPDFFKLPREGKLKEVNKAIANDVSKLREMFKAPSQRKQVDNALNALSKIAPDVEVILHESEQAYAEATGETGRKQKTAGTYDETVVDGKVKKVIHINPDKANARTVAHESFHAILLSIVKTDAEAQRLTAAMIKAVYKSAPAELKKLIDNFAESKNADGSNNYDSALQNEEKLAELIGYLATEYDSLPKPTKSVIKRFLDRLAKMFGMKPFTDSEVIDVLNTIAGKVARGEVISDKDISIINKREISNRTEGMSRNQLQDLFLSDNKVKLKSTKDVAKYLDAWTKENAVFEDDVKNISDREIVDRFVDHLTLELHAWEKVRKDDYISFYDDDVVKNTNPTLQQYAKNEYGRELTDTEVKLYHLVSSFASPSANPEMDSWKGFDIFDRWMKTGELSGYSDKIATVWKTLPGGKRVDTGVPRLDDKGKPARSKVTPAYSQTGLDKFNTLIEKMGGDIDKAMEWITSQHSYSEISDMFGYPEKGPKSMKQNEYMTKDGGGLGVFGMTGAKLGSYILNRFGNFSTVTKDMWYARTMARLSGQDLISVNKKTGKEGAIKTPWSESTKEGRRMRSLADQAFKKVADLFDTSPAMVQERIWDFEKRLYEMLGANEDAAYTSDGLKKGIDRAKDSTTPRKKPITRSRKQIIGENAELSDNVRENLSVARQMEKAGESAKTIRIATGWEKGADGKFRYEIDDVLIKDDFSYKNLKRIPSGMYLGKLSDVIDNQKLFKSYSTRFKREMPMYNDDGSVWEGAIKYDDFPPISDIKVYFREARGGTEVLGEYDQTFKTITINIQPGSSTNEQISETLLHEVQHYIQSREGWQNGGNLDTVVDKNKYSYEDVEKRLSMLDEVRMLLDVESYLESEKGIEPFTSESSEILDAVTDIIKKDVNKEAVNIYESYKDKYDGDGIDGLYEAKSEQENSYRELFNEYLDIPKRYKRLAGEVEARNVQKRRDMTPEQRRKTTLQETENVAREDQIFFTEEPTTRSRKQVNLAPNGKPSNLNQEQYDIVRTPEFKNWFGDWENDPENSSKVVDENGEPLVVYHGSVADFDVFDKKKLGSLTNTEISKAGFFFASKKASADQYVFIGGLQNPYLENKLTEARAFFLNIKNPYNGTNKEWYDLLHWASDGSRKYDSPTALKKANKEFKESLLEDNFDGVDFDNGLEIVAFEPTQAKLADGSNTTFDPDAPSIRKQAPGRSSIGEIVRKGKENNISDAAIRQFAKEEGYTDAEITAAMNIPSSEEIVERSEKAIRDRLKKKDFKGTMRYLRKKIFDRQTYIKDVLKGVGNKKSVRAHNRLVTKAGAKGFANYRFTKAEKEIYSKLSEKEKKQLDALIYARRIVAINENRKKRDEKEYIGAGGYNYDKAKSEVEAFSNDKLSKRADKYFEVFNQNLKRLRDSGRISEDVYISLRDIEYSPIKTIKYIIGDNHSTSEMNNLANSIGVSQKDIMALSDENINDLITDSRWLLMMNISAVENRAATNEVLNLFYDAIESADADGLAAIGDNILDNPIIGNKESKTPKFKYDKVKVPVGYRTVSFFKNGVEYKMVMREEYARQLLDIKVDDKTLKALRKFTFGNVLRFFATSGNPLFIVGNTAVDFQNILFLGDTYSKFKLVGGVELGFDFVNNSLKKMFNTGSYQKTYEEFMTYGGGMDFLSVDGIKAIKGISRFNKPKTLLQKGMVKWGEGLSYLGETSEMAFRLAVYEKTRSKLINQYKKDNKKEPTGQDLEDILYESARESRETIDFSQGGDLVKSADYVLPYLNASVQGARRAVDYASKNPGGFASSMIQYAVMSGGLLASSLYMLSSAFDDEDDEEEKAKKMKDAWGSVSDYEKSAYHIIFTGDVDEDGEYEYYRFKKLPVVGSLSTVVEESIISTYLKSKGVDYEFNTESVSKALDKTSPIGITDIGSRNPVISGVLSYVYNKDTFTGEDIFRGPRGKKILPEAEGILDNKVEQIYKDIAPALGMSPKRTQVMVEKVITNERTNPLVGVMYGGYNGVFSKETTVGEEMKETMNGVLKSFSGKIKRSTNSKLQEYKKMDEVKKVEAEMETEIYIKEQKVYNDIKEKRKNKQDIDNGFLRDIIKENFDKKDWKKYGRKFSTYAKNANIDRSILDLIYEDTPEVQAYKIFSRYGDALDADEKEELKNAIRSARRNLNKKALSIYNKEYRKK